MAFLGQNGLELITLEDDLRDGFSSDKQAAREALYRIEAKGVPHYSIYFDLNMARAAMDDGLAHVCTDKAGNTIIIGHANCESGNPDGDCNCKSGTQSPFRAMLCASIFNMGFSKDVIMQNARVFTRATGGGGLEQDTTQYFSSSEEMSKLPEPVRKVYGEMGQWRKLMLQREKQGRNQLPYLYIRQDATVITLSSFIEQYAGLLILIGAALATAFIGPLSAGLIGQAFKTLTGLAVKYAGKGSITFSDLTEIAVAMAPTLLPAGTGSGKILGYDTKQLTKLAGDGAKVYNSVVSGKYGDIADVFGISKKSDVYKIADMVSKKDVYGIARAAGLPLGEVEKQMQAYKNSEMVTGLIYNYNKIKNQAETLGNGLAHGPIQQYVKNVVANSDIAISVPNALGATGIITNNTKININELKGLTNPLQGQKTPSGTLDRLMLLALIEEAKKNMKNGVKCLVLPGNTNPDLVGEYAYVVQNEVRGSYVVPAEVFGNHYVEFG